MHSSDSDIYTQLLLPRGHGYPLWVPEPDEALPEEYKNVGVEIGDVGLVTSDGGFDFLFNIFLSADHIINQFHGVPEGFVPLQRDEHEFRHNSRQHVPGAHITSSGTKSVNIEGTVTAQIPGAPGFSVGGGIELTFSQQSGAVLMLPEGAGRSNYRNRNAFYEYAADNAKSWYDFVNGSLGRMVSEAGSLYLITGYDKTTAWEAAAFSDPSQEHNVSIKFTAGPFGDGKLRMTRSAGTQSDVSSRSSNPFNTANNQAVFIRGFKISLRQGWKSMLRGAVKVTNFGTTAENDIIYRARGSANTSPRIPESQSGLASELQIQIEGSTDHQEAQPLSASASSTSSLLPAGGISRSRPSEFRNMLGWSDQQLGAGGSTDYLEGQSSSIPISILGSPNSSYAEASDSFEGHSASTSFSSQVSFSSSEGPILNDRMYHPLNIINDYLLDKFQDANIAITHDDDWCSIVKESDLEVPEQAELIRRIEEKYNYCTEPNNDGSDFVFMIPKPSSAETAPRTREALNENWLTVPETKSQKGKSGRRRSDPGPSARSLSRSSFNSDTDSFKVGRRVLRNGNRGKISDKQTTVKDLKNERKAWKGASGKMATGLNDKISKNQTSSTAIEARFAGVFQGEAETGGAVPVPLIAGDLTMESGVDPGTPSKRSTSALGNYEAHSSDGRQMKLDPSNSANGDERARGFVGRDSGRGSKGGNRLTNASRMNHNDRGRGGGGRGRGRGSKGGNFATILL